MSGITEHSTRTLNIDLNAHQPELGEPEQDYIVASTGVKKGELNVNQSVAPGGSKMANVELSLFSTRQKFLPKLVQTKILEAKRLEGKKIVTSALACPAYLLYLSDKSGEHVSVAICGRAAMTDAVTSELGFG
ncbi:hypothetical protein OG21DRAFT_208219 [Imleria badia]|nr:hypothetical protein OG21DRAFT_208219 [Imleria badia]